MPRVKKEQNKKEQKDKNTDKKETVKRKRTSIEKRKESMMRRISKESRRSRIRRKQKKREKDEFDVRLVSIRRVSKVKAGGKRLRMSVLAVVGDRKGHVGVGLEKGRDVKDAQNKAVNQAKKELIKVPMKGQTIPHEVTVKYKAAKVFLKPAAPGTGVIAGDAIRAVVEVAGIKDILSKIIGTNNTITNVYATMEALKNLKLSRFDENEAK